MKTETVGNCHIIVPAGRFDAHTTGEVRAWIKENLASAETPPKLIVDLSQTHFIDSAALAALVHGLKAAREQKGDLHLCDMQTSIKVIFELTRLEKAFPIFATRTEALDAFKTTSAAA